MRGQPTGKHGRDHRADGADPVSPSAWAYATPLAPATTPADYNSSNPFNAAFQNGALNVALPDSTYSPLRWRKTMNGKVQIEGAVDGFSLGATIVTLPSVFWPDTDVTKVISSADGSRAMTCSISATTGNVVVVANVVTASLPGSGVTAGTYGDATHVSQVTVDVRGIVTSASNVPISGVGGGITQSYIGYNTVGGTTDAIGVSSYKQVYTSVTVASAGMLVSIDAYVKGNASNVHAMYAAVMDDNAGAPGKIIGIFAAETASSSQNFAVALNTTARWISIPMTMYLPAATYWLVGMFGNGITLHYDASGGDFTATTAVTWNQAELSAPTNSSRKYSLRGSLIQ